jgi:hypothetical protein
MAHTKPEKYRRALTSIVSGFNRRLLFQIYIAR